MGASDAAYTYTYTGSVSGRRRATLLPADDLRGCRHLPRTGLYQVGRLTGVPCREFSEQNDKPATHAGMSAQRQSSHAAMLHFPLSRRTIVFGEATNGNRIQTRKRTNNHIPNPISNAQ